MSAEAPCTCTEAFGLPCPKHYSGSGSEPPANPRYEISAEGVKPAESGSPPVGPLQALREAMMTERFAKQPRMAMYDATDAALVSVEEQLAALQRENEGLRQRPVHLQASLDRTAGEELERLRQENTRLREAARDALAVLDMAERPQKPRTFAANIARNHLRALLADRGSSPSSPKGDA